MAIGALESPYPLGIVTEQDLQNLSRALWNWEICDDCASGQACTTSGCMWRRSAKLQRYFDFYKEVTSFYVPELLYGSRPALRSHADVFDIIRLLKSQPALPRFQLIEQYFSQRDQPPQPTDQQRAFNLAVTIAWMVACSAESLPSGLLEHGILPVRWRSDHSLTQFMSQAFPATDVGDLRVGDGAGKFTDVKSAVTAARLVKIAGLSFQGTDDLRSHLRLDAKRGVVEIYHHTSVLKEHLMASASPAPGNTLDGGCIYLEGLPRQIALEVIDSVQNILFPLDSGSEKILRSLISRDSFDPDCLRYDSAAYRQEGEENISYTYFGDRLLYLYEELEDPSPRGFIENWLQRKSGARYVMLATLAGVLFAIILGILGLAVGVFQAWVSYEAWKHPVSP